MHKYSVEFILYVYSVSAETVQNSIGELGEGLEIRELPQENVAKGRNLQIHIRTQDPTIIFDTCAELGRIKSVKIH